ncbi:zinc finger BED domain-containing protein RICESLEEPER 3-like [Olea europaea var. sylvestris]|uniref:zinc finger BED domain-containing protein RICESLEEPER 3-like n=1 Tax=Olea europaea var. sylvestris TaxID=158386 RepID=UPI000C1CD8E2|nr:zinc finger BED domain-containing protein RICESLEEPER 3-like [Olea europaea var. sylvestris]
MVLNDIIQEYGIQDMVRSFTFDNAAVNKVVIERFIADLNPEKSFATDVTHRWNSTYLMLNSCENYDKVISLYYNSRHTLGPEHNLEDWEWTIAFYVKKFLQPFFDATKELMDSRLNLTGIKTNVKGISDFLNIELSHVHIESFLCEMYSYYAEKEDSNTSVSSFSSSSSSSTSRAINIGGTNLEIPSELARYICVDVRSVLQPNELQEFSLLNWWRCYERQYPVVSKIARDLLTPPVSTVASEAVFSLGGRILSDERSRLIEDILEALICLKDWECTELHVQEHVDSIMAEELQHIQT